MKRILVMTTMFISILALSMAACNGDGNGGPDCPADKNCGTAVCGPDPVCNLSCGDCEAGETCNAGVCEAPACPEAKDCTGLECGLDPVCGESCGVCGDDETCSEGTCVGVNCPDDKDCTGLECGPDPICDESCGVCTDDQVCLEGTCATVSCPADMDCEGRDCGVDPICCEECGLCPAGQACSLDGTCIDWPPVPESLWKPCSECVFNACELDGDPGHDFTTGVAWYKKDLTTMATTCPEALQSIDPRTKVGAQFYEKDGLYITGTCLYPDWPPMWEGGGSAYNGIIAVCAYWEETYFGFTFSITYYSVVDHNLEIPSGRGYLVIGNLPEDLLGVSDCVLDVDVTMQKCPASADCTSVSCGEDPICFEDCGSCEAGNTCTDEGRCCPVEEDCTGLECGPDPVCGESCGECPGTAVCQEDGTCPTCPDDQDCTDLTCGLDPVCGLSCGDCAQGEVCINDVCVIAGTPAETVDVAAGTFQMGCNSDVDNECNPFESNEDPLHDVNLSAYKIYKYEVTASEYKACVDAAACTAPATSDGEYTYDVAGKEDHPINGTTWAQAQTFCTWVGGSLPTEAQWEKAARGDDARKYPWGNTPEVSCDLAVVPEGGVGGCGTGETMPVGSKPDGASPYGAEDMIGSVWEWVADFYAADYYADSPVNDPLGPDTGVKRIIRGGSWDMSDTAFLRASMRHSYEGEFESDTHGFRCALPAD